MSSFELNYVRRGAGEPLLLLHGSGAHWQVWEPVLDIVGRERDVIAVDLPGFGDSPPVPSGVAPSGTGLAPLLAAFLDSLGLDRAHVGGN